METLALQRPVQPQWRVVEFTCPNNNDAELIIAYQSKFFVLRSTSANFSDSPQVKERYLRLLHAAKTLPMDGYTVEDFYNWAIEPLLCVLRNLPIRAGSWFLDDYLFPEYFFYDLRANAGKLVAVPLESSPRRDMKCQFGVNLPDEACLQWPSLAPFQVRLCRPCPSTTAAVPPESPSKAVLRDGTVVFVKLARRGDKDNLLRELDTYAKISNATLDDTLLVPRLKSLVRDGIGTVYGLLLTYIDCGHRTLARAVPGTPQYLREKWATQIQQTVRQLHSMGIVWGDVKPDNVLIDSDQNAWVVDFGGGYTDGWVPSDLAETVEGDLAGLKRLTRFLDVESKREPI